jgi:fructosamine-3-kinase
MSRTGVEPKPAWQQVPLSVRAAVERALGRSVRRAERVYGGYSPAPTFRMLLDGGGRAFFKGVGPKDNEFAVAALGRELRYYRVLEPSMQPWAPAVLGAGECDGWQYLLLEDLGPKSVPPWTEAAARGVMQAFAEFHLSTLGTSLDAEVPQPSTYLSMFSRQWGSLLKRERLDRVAARASDATAALRWLEQHVPTLAAIAGTLPEAPAPHALLHGDLRSDNLRWRNGRLRMFDWPHLGLGPPEFDAAASAQAITVEGGPQPERLVTWYGERLPLRAVILDAAVASCAGYMASVGWQDDPPGLPRVRSFQRAQMGVLLRWAARRLDLPEPAWLEGYRV